MPTPFRPGLQFSHIFHKSFLMHQAGVLSVSQDANEAQPELDETLIDKTHGRVIIKCNRGLHNQG